MRRCLSSMKLHLNNQIDLISNYIKSQKVYAFITDRKKNFKFVSYIKATVIERRRIFTHIGTRTRKINEQRS